MSDNLKSNAQQDKAPLMPMAVAMWLVDNTSLTFHQIATFCHLKMSDVLSIADGNVAGMVECNPVSLGQITQEEIKLCQEDPSRIPKLSKLSFLRRSKKKSRKYSPIVKRRDKPDAICYLLKKGIADSQICRLIGTTPATIEAVRSKTHWNIENIRPKDPAALGLCSQSDLDDVVRTAEIAQDMDRRLRVLNEKASQEEGQEGV